MVLSIDIQFHSRLDNLFSKKVVTLQTQIQINERNKLLNISEKQRRNQ